MTVDVENLIHARWKGQMVHITVLSDTNRIAVRGQGETKEKARKEWYSKANKVRRGLENAFPHVHNILRVLPKGEQIPGAKDSIMTSDGTFPWWTVEGFVYWPVMAHDSKGEPVRL